MKRQTFSKPYPIGCWLLAILLAGVCGCGHRATVTGKVTYQGRPVRHGTVILLGGDKMARAGVVQPDGSYLVEGVPPGSVKIGVISGDPSKGRSPMRDGKRVRPGRIEGWFPLPSKFEAPETSGLSCTVDSGHVNHDIELK
jgi:hypothetical protein